MISFRKAVFTLLGGHALAQIVPLLLGPWLARLYTPEAFAVLSTMAALGANLAVVASFRFEQALPLTKGQVSAKALLALSVVSVVPWVLVAALAGWLLHLLGWSAWLLALPLGVGGLALVQIGMAWGTSRQAFFCMSQARVWQYAGAALVQLGLGYAVWLHGPTGGGLVLGWMAGSCLAACWLLHRLPVPRGGWRAVGRVSWRRMRACMRRHRAFPCFNAPHAFMAGLQDTLTFLCLATWAGDVAAGFWGLAIRYLKAPAALVGSSVSQALYPRLVGVAGSQARQMLLRTMGGLALVALPWSVVLLLWGPELFMWVFGPQWQEAGHLARALAPYIALHLVASPLSVVVLAWELQAWALRLALAGQVLFLAALGLGLQWGGLEGAGWAISTTMSLYFLYFFAALMHHARQRA